MPGTDQPHSSILLRATHDQHCPLLPGEGRQGEHLEGDTVKAKAWCSEFFLAHVGKLRTQAVERTRLGPGGNRIWTEGRVFWAKGRALGASVSSLETQSPCLRLCQEGAGKRASCHHQAPGLWFVCSRPELQTFFHLFPLQWLPLPHPFSRTFPTCHALSLLICLSPSSLSPSLCLFVSVSISQTLSLQDHASLPP